MEPKNYVELKVLLYEDLARDVEALAHTNGESMESCIESVLRERFGFDGPKHPIYVRPPE